MINLGRPNWVLALCLLIIGCSPIGRTFQSRNSSSESSTSGVAPSASSMPQPAAPPAPALPAPSPSPASAPSPTVSYASPPGNPSANVLPPFANYDGFFPTEIYLYKASKITTALVYIDKAHGKLNISGLSYGPNLTFTIRESSNVLLTKTYSNGPVQAPYYVTIDFVPAANHRYQLDVLSMDNTGGANYTTYFPIPDPPPRFYPARPTTNTEPVTALVYRDNVNRNLLVSGQGPLNQDSVPPPIGFLIYDNNGALVHQESHPFIPSVTFYEKVNFAADPKIIYTIKVQSAYSTSKAGANVIALCTNTMHIVANEVLNGLTIPFIHIAHPTATSILARGLRCVGLLGTRFTMEQEFYRLEIEKKGLKVMVPPSPARLEIHRIIYEELCQGTIRTDSALYFYNAIADFKAQGCDGVILGCTEIGLLVRAQDSALPIFDTTVLHAHALVDAAIN